MEREIACQVCGNVFLGRTSAKSCPLCRVEREYIQKKVRDARYKDKRRHNGKRSELLDGKCGLTCAMCGKGGNTYEIVTHHIDHDSSNHEKQVQLCRSCHALEHYDESNLGNKKQAVNENVRNITKSQVEKSLQGIKKVEEACEILGITRSTLYKLRKKFGLSIFKPQKVTLNKEELMAISHLSQKKQIKVLGISRRTLCVHRQKFGLQQNPPIKGITL